MPNRGMTFFGARYYGNGEGRWLTVDPVKSKTPQGLNRYTYVLNDPVNHIDPQGTTCQVVGYVGLWETPIYQCDLGFGPGGPINSGGSSGWPFSEETSLLNQAELYPDQADNTLGGPRPCKDMADVAQIEADTALAISRRNLGEALAIFDQGFSQRYIGHPIDSIPNAVDLVIEGGQHGRTVPNYYLGQRDFKDEFKDDERSADQTHHFAGYFSAGMNGVEWAALLHSLNDARQGNWGDVNLGKAAFEMGARLRENPGLLKDIGKEISDTFCNK